MCDCKFLTLCANLFGKNDQVKITALRKSLRALGVCIFLLRALREPPREDPVRVSREGRGDERLAKPARSCNV